MMNRSDPQVKDRSEKGSKSSWTRITFRPDLKRFLLDDIDADILSLMQRRVVDIAACNPRLDVRLNGRSLKVPSLADYIALHAGLDASEFASINVNKQWQLAVGPTSSGRFESTSFVNSVATMRGGSHVDAVVAQIRHYLSGVVEKELRRSGSSTPRIKDFLHVFLICTVANPAFESQTKVCTVGASCNALSNLLFQEMLTTPANTFAKHATLSHSALEAIRFNTKIVDNILTAAEKRSREILKKTDGRKLKQVRFPFLRCACRHAFLRSLPGTCPQTRRRELGRWKERRPVLSDTDGRGLGKGSRRQRSLCAWPRSVRCLSAERKAP